MKTTKLLTTVLALFLCMGIMGCEEDAPPRKGKSDAVFNPNLTYGSMTDIDGNEYKTIKIGKQTWMAQNLRVTHYRNGDPINFDTDSTTNWSTIKVGTYCTPLNTSNIDTIATYGLLYNGYAVLDNRNIAPKGWRIPSREDVEQLWAYLKSLETPEDKMRISGRLKEAGTKHWDTPNIANNSSGFTLLPTKMRYVTAFDKNHNESFLFTTTFFKKKEEQLFSYGAISISDIKGMGSIPLIMGLPIRCIKEK